MSLFTSKIWKEDILHELYLTFSAKKSLLSSKKIERFCTFFPATAMIVIYFTCHVLCFKCANLINVGEVVLLSTTLYGYGAYNTWRIEKDKQQAKNDSGNEG
jgi:hypothetical protein